MATDLIIIEDLRFEAIIGILPDERQTPQAVRIDMQLLTDIAQAAGSGAIADTIDYAAIAEATIHFVQQAHAELIEPLIEQLAERLLGDQRIAAVKIRLTKPDALAAAAAVGVQIVRPQHAVQAF